MLWKKSVKIRRSQKIYFLKEHMNHMMFGYWDFWLLRFLLILVSETFAYWDFCLFCLSKFLFILVIETFAYFGYRDFWLLRFFITLCREYSCNVNITFFLPTLLNKFHPTTLELQQRLVVQPSGRLAQLGVLWNPSNVMAVWYRGV